MLLDGTKGSIARFVNHSCEPNCTMQKWTVNGEPHMGLFAGKDGIMTGDELTYDYNFAPFSTKNTQKCLCGAKNCRGSLAPTPKEPKPKDVKEVLEPLVKKSKRKLTASVEDAKEVVRDTLGLKRRKINPAKGARPSVDGKMKKEVNLTPKEKPLPKGWIYPEKAQEFKVVNDADPEEILKASRNKRKATDHEGHEEGQSSKKPRLTTAKEEDAAAE